MSVPVRSIGGYQIKLRTSRYYYLLVEGRNDKGAFERLEEEAERNGYTAPQRIFIDTAEELDSPARVRLGNREKVIEVWRTIDADADKHVYQHKFVGFIDREFDNFSIAVSGPISDAQASAHSVVGRLVTTHGHSMENYFFDFDTLRQPLRQSSGPGPYQIALGKFAEAFDAIVTIACAVGLVGREVGLLSLVSNSVSWDAIYLHGSTATLDTDKWKEGLIATRHLDTNTANRIVERYGSWLISLRDVDRQVIRRLCHGHTGLSVLWSAYARCMYDATHDGTQAANVLRLADRRYYACLEVWLQRIFTNGVVSPLIALEMLGLRVSVPPTGGG